jgi:hypothetical protein
MSPEDMARTKDMLAELNQMLDRPRRRSTEPDFDGFMERFGDFFPENPQNLDELLEQMAQRMAAMQAMLNSMTPEQRAQLQGCPTSCSRTWTCAGRWTSSAQPAAGVPRRRAGAELRLQGGPAGLRRGRPDHEELGDLDQLENLLRRRGQPRRAGRGRHGPGPRAPGRRRRQAWRSMAELAKMLEEAGLIENRRAARAHP